MGHGEEVKDPRRSVAPGRAAAALGLVMVPALLALGACSPELGATPFACLEDGRCPEGYSCQSGVCVGPDETLAAVRPMRVAWINAAEMYWFPSSGGGATLVVNDGFSTGGRGLYEIVVGTDGAASAPRTLLDLEAEFPTASAVVAIDETRYGVATLRFPRPSELDMELAILAIERERSGDASVVETLFNTRVPYLGGSEPPYIGAIARDGSSIDVVYTSPDQGGRVVLIHVERSGAVWGETRRTEVPLPDGVPPLSGDDLLWATSDGGLALRTGLEATSVLRFDAEGIAGPWIATDGLPIFAYDDAFLELSVDDDLRASYALLDDTGAPVESEEGGAFQESLEPYTATAHAGGALVAPLSDDPTFGTLEVGWRGPDQPLRRVASIEREGSDELYSARAFARDGRVWVAWTAFHESLMDLWIATAEAEGLP